MNKVIILCLIITGLLYNEKIFSKKILKTNLQLDDTLLNELLKSFDFEKINPINFLQKVFSTDESKPNMCSSCIFFYSNIQNILKQKYGISFLNYISRKICSIYQNEDVCKGMVETWSDLVFNNLAEDLANPHYYCSGKFFCDRFIPISSEDFAKEILKEKPPKKIKQIKGNKKFKMMQMTDVHVDLLYKEGTLGDCGQPLCCREKFGVPQENAKKAGKFGYFGNCDLPKETIINFLSYVENEIKPDFIIWTGDSPSHDIYESNKEEAIESLKFISNELKSRFKIPIYPVIGNHEFFPADNYDLLNSEVNSFTFEKTALIWKDFLGDEAYKTFKKYGYYSKKHTVNGTETNLRIISLNTVDCDVLNINLLRNPSIALNQFEWLEQQLDYSEKNNEVVYIIGHIPPGDSTHTTECSKRYNVLSDRYENVILGHFYGHTHYDEFRIIRGYFDKNNIVNIVQTAPSLTTWPSKYPQFRVFELESETFLLVDYNQYYLNLTKSNEYNGNPEWEFQYRASEQFGLNSLQDFEGYQKYVEQLLVSDEKVVNKTIINYFGMPKELNSYIGNTRISKDLGCRFGNDVFEDVMKCNDYQTYDIAYDRMNLFLSRIYGKWYKLTYNNIE